MEKLDLRSAKFKRILMALYDIITINLSYVLAMIVSPEDNDFTVLLQRALPITVVYIVLLAAFNIYTSMWAYAGSKEAVNIFAACVFGGLSGLAVDMIMSKLGFAAENLEYGCFSAAFYVLGTIFTLIFIAGIRFVYRIARRYLQIKKLEKSEELDRVMIVGAGDMGMIMINEMERGSLPLGKPVVAIDDNPIKKGQRIRGIPIKGDCNQIPEIAKKYKIDTIVICMPSVDAERQTEIMKIAVTTGCKLKTSPSLLEMSKDGVQGQARDVNITDLISRPEVKLNPDVCRYINNKVVLVTGGGGSIGSEICCQICKYKPEKIVIFDIYENNAYMLKHKLDSYYAEDIDVEVRIGSVRDEVRLVEIFEEFHPSIVFHAAAHKHVPLMEDSPKEAVKNNVFGTYNLARIAVDYKVSRFVSISTDKAVNPANVMGATKRITEMIVQYFGRKCNNSTIFAAVRFGNVLGSNGSVIPIFTEQIKNGGPVTVTHPEITRYFMTIPEAAQLVAQAGGLAKGGEIFVLDMGEPVKIITLAENLIRLSGYTPYTDIKIEYSGLRPGEKLYEELSLEEENNEREKTANNKIFVTKPLAIDDDTFEKELEKLRYADEKNIRDSLKRIVPNYIESPDYTCMSN